MSQRHILIKFYLFSFLTGIWLSGPILMPFYREWGHLTQFQVQLLQSWSMLVLTLIKVPTGVFADRYGRRKSLVIGLLLGAAASVWYGTVGTFLAFILGEVAFAFHLGFISGADRALLSSLLNKNGSTTRLSTILTYSFIIHMVALVISGPIGRYIADYGLNLPILLSAVPSLLAAVVVLTLPESYHQSKSDWLTLTKRGLTYLIRHPQHRRATLAAVVTSAAAYFVYWLYPSALANLRPTDLLTASTYAFLTFVTAEILISLVYTRLNDHRQHQLLHLGRLLTTLGFLILLVIPGWPGFVLFILTAGGFGMSHWDLYLAQLQHHLPEAEQAAINSGAQTIKQILLILVNPLIGWLANTTPTPAILALVLLSSLAILLQPRPR